MNMLEQTIKRAKAVVEEQEEQSQSQGTILKAISKIVEQQRQEIPSRPKRKLFDERGGQHPRNFQEAGGSHCSTT